MKMRLIAVVLLSLLLTGCSGKDTNANLTSTGSSGVQTSNGDGVSEQSTVEERVEVKTDFQPVKPNTVPKLSPKQKSQIDSKIIKTLDNIDKTLKSLQDVPEIDLSTLDK